MYRESAQAIPRPELTRGVGAWAAIAVNVTNMIGAGVFLKTRVMTCNVGSAKMVMLVWVAAGLLSLAGTFSYSEIAAMMPEAGGDYVYLRRAYSRVVGFLFGWMAFAVFRTGAQAALAVGLAIFMNVALGGALQQWHIDGQLVGLHLQRRRFDPGRARDHLDRGAHQLCVRIDRRPHRAAGDDRQGRAGARHRHRRLPICARRLDASRGFGHCSGAARVWPPRARGGIAGFGAAMLGALWAYDGWNNVAPLAGEIRDPQRNLPRAFVGGMLVVGALYLFVNTAYYYALTPLEIADIPTSSSVATEVLKRFLGPIAVSLTAVALMISSFGSLHASVLANSRIPFAMARDGLFFRSLAKLSPRSNVPVRAIVAQAVWGSVLAVSGTYDTLTDSVIFASWLFYGLSTASLFVFRRTMPDAPRPYRAFGYPVIPCLFLLVTAALLVNTFVAAPRQALQGVALLLLGLPFYWYWSRRTRPDG